jgi:septal ring factor EnvC (AmiA/AmiB activator)
MKKTPLEVYVMAESAYHFRTALSGFHKGDVTAYIEKLISAHRSALLEQEKTITELQKENRSLHQQLNLLMLSTPAPAPAEAPAPAPTPAPAPEPAPAPVPVSAPVHTDVTSLELQAYRRAEAVEHAANVRALQLYQQLEVLYTDSIDEIQLTDAAVKQTIEAITQQANSLEQAYNTLTTALDASRNKLAAINALLNADEENN